MKYFAVFAVCGLLLAVIGCEFAKNFFAKAGESAAEQAKKDPPTSYVDLISIAVNAAIAGLSYAIGEARRPVVNAVKRRRAVKKLQPASIPTSG